MTETLSREVNKAEKSTEKARAIFKASNRLPYPERIILYNKHSSENGPFQEFQRSQFRSMSLGLFEHQIRQKLLTKTSETALKELHKILESREITEDLREVATQALIEYLGELKKAKVDTLKSVLKSSPKKIISIKVLLTYVKNQFIKATELVKASLSLLNESMQSTDDLTKPLQDIIHGLEVLLKELDDGTINLIEALKNKDLATDLKKMLLLSVYSTNREDFDALTRQNFHATALELFDAQVTNRLDGLTPTEAVELFRIILNDEGISLEFRCKVEQAAHDYFTTIAGTDVALIEQDLAGNPLYVIDNGRAILKELENDTLYRDIQTILSASYTKKKKAATLGFSNEFDVLLAKNRTGNPLLDCIRLKKEQLARTIRQSWIGLREDTDGFKDIQKKQPNELPTTSMIRHLIRELSWMDVRSNLDDTCELIDILGGAQIILRAAQNNPKMKEEITQLLKEFAGHALEIHYDRNDRQSQLHIVLWNVVIALGGREALLSTPDETKKYLDFLLDGTRNEPNAPTAPLTPPPSLTEAMENRGETRTTYTPPSTLPPPPPPLTSPKPAIKQDIVRRLLEQNRRLENDDDIFDIDDLIAK